MLIDLHVHSSASDGTDPPEEVVRQARAADVDVVALTDHDTVAGLAAARRALPPGLTLVAGIELSCRVDEMSVHMLGYLFDPTDPDLAAEQRRIRDDRVRRARAMVDRLAALGVPITWEMVREVAGAGVIGRPHIAQAMVAAGVIDDPAQAFTADWIAPGGRAYVDRYALDPRHAVALIRRAGGVAVLAHPRARRRGRILTEERIAELAAAGLAGIEVDHPDHDPADRARLRDLAADLGLVATGSSDDHGRLTGHRIGCETTTVSAYERLVAQASGTAPVSG